MEGLGSLDTFRLKFYCRSFVNGLGCALLCHICMNGCLVKCVLCTQCDISFPLFLSLVPLNDKKTLELRALSFDRDDELGEPGLEEVLKAKKPKELRKGNPSTLSLLLHFARHNLSLSIKYQMIFNVYLLYTFSLH
jgi:hypothetical protein